MTASVLPFNTLTASGVVPLANSILSPFANPAIAFDIVPVGNPRINVPGAPALNATICAGDNAPAMVSVPPAGTVDRTPLPAASTVVVVSKALTPAVSES